MNKIQDSGWHKIILEMMKDHRVTVGIHEKDNERDDAAGPTNAQIGYWHEYGEGVPQRSFLRDTIDENEDRYRTYVRRGFEKIARGQLDVDTFMNMLGNYATGKVKAKIHSNIPPELAESTKKRKTVRGKVGDVALIDTGDLIQAIDFEVR